jgi:transposase
MKWGANPSGKRGRSRTFSDATIQTCLTMKVLFGMALRQTTGFVESLLRLMGLDWDVPDFSTICRRQRTLAVNIPYHGAKGPLHLLIDSTGIKVEGEGEWNARKHGGHKRRVWRKIHIGIDEQTLEVRAVEITGSNTGDAPMLPYLLNQIPRNQEIGSVTADGAYDTRRCHNAIAERGAAAVIPPRRNAQGIAKLLVADCEVLEKAGLCCHFDGVIGPEAERIAAGVTVRDCGELIAAGAEYQVDLIMRGQKPLSLPV